MSADGPNDIWGIYRNDTVTHYNGTSWSSTTLSTPSGTPVFESVEALSPTPDLRQDVCRICTARGGFCGRLPGLAERLADGRSSLYLAMAPRRHVLLRITSAPFPWLLHAGVTRSGYH